LLAQKAVPTEADDTSIVAAELNVGVFELVLIAGWIAELLIMSVVPTVGPDAVVEIELEIVGTKVSIAV